ncbi:hypothetical protein HZA85_02960 [Candidatus Uhrbacteria bacterium]|nr:hypothetical protein [Candidatus Uhrbacteria bacterium]
MVNFPFKRQEEVPAQPPEVLHSLAPEVSLEQSNEQPGQSPEQSLDKKPEATEPTRPADLPTTTPFRASPSVSADPMIKRIESILEEDMTDLYLNLSPKDQVVFKQKGEETLTKIRVLMQKTKVNAKKIFELIRAWLRLIPGVNRFFLEQEAKIKTDKILLSKDRES